MYSMSVLAFLVFWLASPTDVTVVSLPLRGSVELALTPAGKAQFQRAGTLSRVKVEVDSVAEAGSIGAGLNAYVAWAVSPEGEFENIGELAVVDGKLRFEGFTRFDQFGLLITAEPHYLVDLPNSAVAFRNQPPRDLSVRRASVTAQVGVSDYSKLQRGAPAALGAAAQARTAFEIALSEGADRLAEAELRLARIALDTMEEMLNRASPPDIVLPPAHEAIRRSHRALVLAREATTRNLLNTARAEAANLGRDKQQLTARVEELARQQAAANDRVRTLETNLAEASRENRQLADERAQAGARILAIEREVEEMRTKLAAEKPAAIRIPDEYVDPVSLSLTNSGREALAKLVSTADLWLGPLRIEGSEKAVAVAQKFFMDSGIPADRFVVIGEKRGQ